MTAAGVFAASPLELAYLLLSAEPSVVAVAAGGVHAGPVSHEEALLGAVSIVPQGMGEWDPEGLTFTARLALRCTAVDASHVERIAMICYQTLNTATRRLVLASDGQQWLVHRSPVIVGPSLAIQPDEGLYVATAYTNLQVGAEPYVVP